MADASVFDKQATIEHICARLAEGNSLRKICRELELAESTVRYWLRAEGDNFPQYVRARELQADSYFDAVVEIADDTTMNADDRRIAIDARKWAAGKLHGKYNDKIKVEQETTVRHEYDLDKLGSAELEQLEATLARASGSSGGAGTA